MGGRLHAPYIDLVGANEIAGARREGVVMGEEAAGVRHYIGRQALERGSGGRVVTAVAAGTQTILATEGDNAGLAQGPSDSECRNKKCKYNSHY
jgi:hypothetical protein